MDNVKRTNIPGYLQGARILDFQASDANLVLIDWVPNITCNENKVKENIMKTSSCSCDEICLV